jgi:F-type H+-transporting ATPase subunit delta
MARSATARRYAKALFELAKESGRVAEVAEELRHMAALLADNRELHDTLFRPLHPVAQRQAVLNGVTERIAASPNVRSFFCLLIDQRRLVNFPAIHEEFERLTHEDAGVRRAEIVAAGALSDDQLERLRQALAARTGCQIEVTVRVDPSLLGGVVAKVGDLVFDGSLRTQLSQLRANLTR